MAETAQACFMAAVNGVSGGQVGPAPGGVLLRDKTGVVMKAAGLISETRSET